MNQVEIALIIIGIIVIIISCIMIDKAQKLPNQLIGKSLSQVGDNLNEDEKKQLMEKMKELLSEAREETILRTEDALSQISNEKIMAVSEFSDQIIEKMKRNHEEVVFLYNMLNDKEKELKLTVREIDSSKKKVQDILNSKAESDKQQAVKNMKTQTAAKAMSQAATTQTEKPVKATARPIDTAMERFAVNGPNANNNSQILELYSGGRSVVEISKLLGLGQGEVKLVIDLFRGKK